MGRITGRCFENVSEPASTRRPVAPRPSTVRRMPGKTILFVHGAAVTAAIWDPVLAHLDGSHLAGYDLVTVDRPRTGDLARETDWLARRARGTFVVGMSGGATLGLALAASEVRLAGALLHEPAVGSLAPDLLDGVAAAFADGGVVAFGATLYGQRWTESMAPQDRDSLAAELAMFRGFEPAAPARHQGPVTVSVGELSPPARHRSVAALVARYGGSVAQVPGASHLVSLEAPDAFATLIARSAAVAFG